MEISKNKHSVKDITFIGLMAALICIAGPISINLPFSPVPISLTNLAIYFAAIILGFKKGTISCIVYILIGIVGLPVFSNFSGGFSKIAGPTGGYIVGFIFMAMIVGIFSDIFNGKRYMYVIGMVLGTIVTYTIGTLYLSFQTHMTLISAIAAGVLPFIAGDIIKMVITVIFAPEIKKRVAMF